MTVKIKNRYSSLTRELNLEGGPEQFELRPDVQPVVVLHEHCEGDALFHVLNQPGATGPAFLDQLPGAQPGFRSGAYALRFEVQWNIAVATSVMNRVNFDLTNSAGVGSPLWTCGFGTSNRQAGSDVFQVSKMHLPENSFIFVDLLGATLAADHLLISMWVQPV